MFHLNYLHLHHFFVIASEGQIARAAKRLSVGQPTLSTQLKQFEQMLGYRLFERKRGETLKLTEKGGVIFAYAREIFRIGDEMIEVADGLRTKKTNRLRLGALDSLPKRLVFELTEKAMQLGDCTISLYEDNGAQLMAGLREHRYDIVISTSPAPHMDERPTKSKKLKEIPIIVCGAKKFAGLSVGFPDSLREKKFVLPTPDGKLRSQIDEFFRIHRTNADVIGEAQDVEVLRLIALSGRALVPVSRLTVEEDLRVGRLVSLGELEGVREEIWISTASRIFEHPVAARLMKHAKI